MRIHIAAIEGDSTLDGLAGRFGKVPDPSLFLPVLL